MVSLISMSVIVSDSHVERMEKGKEALECRRIRDRMAMHMRFECLRLRLVF